MSVDFYTVLGVCENATQAEIKAAYHLKAKEWHPDKCEGNEPFNAFHLIQEAYDTLKDEKKRAIYERTLLKPHTIPPNVLRSASVQKLFASNSFFSKSASCQLQSSFEKSQGRSLRKRNLDAREDILPPSKKLCKDIFPAPPLFPIPKQSEKFSLTMLFKQTPLAQVTSTPTDQGAILIDVDLSFQDSIKGCQKNISFQRTEKCSRDSKLPPVSSHSVCTTPRVESTLILDIPPGVTHRKTQRIKGEGNHHQGRRGDVIITFMVRTHSFFTLGVDGHVSCSVDVPYSHLCLGGILNIPNARGEPLSVTIKPRTEPGKIINVPNGGISYCKEKEYGKQHAINIGNMSVQLRLHIPVEFSIHQEKLLLALNKANL